MLAKGSLFVDFSAIGWWNSLGLRMGWLLESGIAISSGGEGDVCVCVCVRVLCGVSGFRARARVGRSTTCLGMREYERGLLFHRREIYVCLVVSSIID